VLFDFVFHNKSTTKERSATVGKHRKERSLFQLINRNQFEELAKKWGMDKGVRSFNTWEMTQALLVCLMMRLGSYREVEGVLGIPDSTFGDALRKRHFGFFQELCDCILLEIRGRTSCRKVKRSIRQILAIDSSDIRVHGSLFTEPGWKQKHTIGHQAAAKLHVVWNVDGQWIDDFLITPGRCGDSPVSLKLRLLPGKMYVFDRAYNDFNFWSKITACGSDFVARLKDCEKNRQLLKKVLRGNQDRSGVLYDGPYHSTSPSAKDSDLKLRHVIYRDRLTGKVFHFVTSDQRISAKAVSDVYKQRWAVELLFRWLKGHLDIRYLPTRTINTVKTQLAVAVLVQLLVQLKKIVDGLTGTLWEVLRKIRVTLIRKVISNSGPPDDCRWNTASVANVSS
jgi:putative transposase